MPSEGVRVLTEHLKRHKAEATERISVLETEAVALKQTNDALRQQLQTCLDELDFRHGQIEQLKLENTRKWRIEERNDWKSLVDSVRRCHPATSCPPTPTPTRLTTPTIDDAAADAVNGAVLPLATTMHTLPCRAPPSLRRTTSITPHDSRPTRLGPAGP